MNPTSSIQDEKSLITSTPLARFHQRIAEKATIRSTPPVLIVALGDSVTSGSSTNGAIMHDDVYHAQLKRLLEKCYPSTVFSVINAGDDGRDAVGGFARLERDVLHHRPDLVIIGYGLNDATASELAGLDTYEQALEALVWRTREATDADIILLTPNMMCLRHSDDVPETYHDLIDRFIRIQKDGILAAYAQRLREVAARLDVPVADVYGAWEELAASGVDTTAMLVNGLNHPTAAGHTLTADLLMAAIETYSVPNLHDKDE